MIGFRAAPELRTAIETAASTEDDKPSRSEMIRRIVTNWLRQRGYVLKGGQNGPRRD